MARRKQQRDRREIVLLAVRTGSEDTIRQRIKALGLDAYVPKYLVNLRRGGLTARVLFPGYMFVWIENQWDAVRNLIGVYGFVQFGDRIIRIPPRVIRELRARETKTGYVRLDSSFIPGQMVKVIDGPLVPGIYLGMSDRLKLRVLFSLLGAETELEFFERDLVLAS
jgi:transcription antitermination factor NusG